MKTELQPVSGLARPPTPHPLAAQSPVRSPGISRHPDQLSSAAPPPASQPPKDHAVDKRPGCCTLFCAWIATLCCSKQQPEPIVMAAKEPPPQPAQASPRAQLALEITPERSATPINVSPVTVPLVQAIILPAEGAESRSSSDGSTSNGVEGSTISA